MMDLYSFPSAAGSETGRGEVMHGGGAPWSILCGTRQAAAGGRAGQGWAAREGWEVLGLNIVKAGAVTQWDKRERPALQQPTAGAAAWRRAAGCIVGGA